MPRPAPMDLASGHLATTPGSSGGERLRRQLAGLALLATILLLFAFNLNYLIAAWFSAPGARIAVAVAPEVPLLVAFLGLALLFVVVTPRRGDALATLSMLSLLAFSAWTVLLSVAVHGNIRAAVTLLIPLLIFIASYGLARSLGRPLMRAAADWLPLVPFATLALLLGFLASGRVVFDYAWAKPQILGGLHSTEMAIFIGLQLLYCLHALDVAKLERRRVVMPWLAAALALLLLLWMMSVGSTLAVLLLLALRPLLASGRRGAGWLGSAALLLAVVLAGAAFLSADYLSSLAASKLRDYSEEGVRLPTMLLLLEYIRSEPWTGIGLGEFVNRSYLLRLREGLYPHNNLLGIAAELGVPAALAYLCFVVATIAAGTRAVRREVALASELTLWPLALLALLAFAYLQIKGLVQDTWQLKENYFWAGVLAGVLNPLRRRRAATPPATRAAPPAAAEAR